MNSWIVRYGEIALKGRNRHLFEKRLVDNIKNYLKKNKLNFKEIKRVIGRIVVFSDDDCGILKNVFGIVSISHAIESDLDLNEIKEQLDKFFIKGIKNSFRVSTKRIDKDLPYKSNDIDIDIGAYISEQTKSKVNLKNFESEIGIELFNNKAYIFNKRVKAFGGLPEGIEGKVYCMINGPESLLAAWLMMRRGCYVECIAYDKKDMSWINKYSAHNLKLKIILNLKELDINQALVVDDKLPYIKKYEFEGLILRPLITMSKKEINTKIKAIK